MKYRLLEETMEADSEHDGSDICAWPFRGYFETTESNPLIVGETTFIIDRPSNSTKIVVVVTALKKDRCFVKPLAGRKISKHDLLDCGEIPEYCKELGYINSDIGTLVDGKVIGYK